MLEIPLHAEKKFQGIAAEGAKVWPEITN